MTTIEAVLPLTLRDAERAELLFASLAKNFSGLRRIWVVCPDAQLNEIRIRYAALSLPFELRIEPELSIVPEFALKVRQSGWFRQQVIKLAIHEHVESDLYLTLDADVICTRPVTAAQLVGDGRGVCFVASHNTEFNYWYQRVEQVLRLHAARTDVMHNVTPALLHKQGVNALRMHIESLISSGRYSQGMRGVKQRWHVFWSTQQPGFAAWRIFLIAARPWTEYALYYTYLEASGQFERYHIATTSCIYDNAHSLWHADNNELPADWDPAPAFTGAGPPWFLVAQSNTGVSAEQMRKKLLPLIEVS